MLVELIYRGSARYMRAPIPPQHLQDAKFMAVQERFKAALASMTTAQQLYDAVPRARPLDRGAFLTHREDLDGVYKYNKALFDSLPEFDWDILMQFKMEGSARPGPAPVPTTPGDWEEAARLALLPIEEA